MANDEGEFGFPDAAKLAETLFFKTPLYDPLPISEFEVKGIFVDDLIIDGYCPYCKEKRTFRRRTGTMTQLEYERFDFSRHSHQSGMIFQCARYEHHRLYFYYRLERSAIQKIGQLPSFADIAIDESKQYTKLLSAEDAAEFHKAIGLAAHGVGIGSLVYLKRIFERLIQKRFDQFKEAEGWDDEQFKNLRMNERIDFLRSHLPDFLVRNSRIYSILSLGVHELDEKSCLAFFPVLRSSTIVILEEDKKKKEDLDRQKALEKAIASFEHPQRENRAAKKTPKPAVEKG